MSAKLFFVVLLLNVLGATIASNENSTSETSSELNATSSVKYSSSVMDTLITEIKEFANISTAAIDALNEQVANITQQMATLVADKVDEVLENVNTAIGNAVSENGTDSEIYECANAQLNNTEQVIANISSEHAACVESAIEEVTSVGTDLATLIVDAFDLIEEIESGSEACEALSSALAQAVCWSELLVTSTASSAKITAEGTALLTKMATLKDTVPANMETCALKALASAAVAETEIIANIALCSANSVISKNASTECE